MSKRSINILLAVFILVLSVSVYGCITIRKQAATAGGAILIPGTLEGAPPFIPHDVEDEQACPDCHRLGENEAVITPHPDRVNCVQCHITQDMSVKPFVENTF